MYKMYKPRPCEGGWHIWYVEGPGRERLALEGKVYPQRQNAYRRAKRLNDGTSTEARIATFRVRCRFESVAEVELVCRQALTTIAHRPHATILTLDHSPALPTPVEDQERELLFCVHMEEAGDQLREEWMSSEHDVSEAELDEIRRTLDRTPGVFTVSYAFDDIKIFK